MSNNKIPIVLGLVGVGLLTLVGGGLYFRKTGKEWIRESQAYDEAAAEESREKQQRLTQQLENEYDPNYADEEALFGSSSSEDSGERISDLFAANQFNDRDSFSDKGGSKKNRKPKKSVSKRMRREKSNKNQNKKHKRKNKTNKIKQIKNKINVYTNRKEK